MTAIRTAFLVLISTLACTAVVRASGNATATFADAYRTFLGTAKTERMVVRDLTALAREKGFVPLDGLTGPGKPPLPAGTKVYRLNRDKSLFLGVTGTQPLSDGFNLLEAHGDACRLDLKQNPLYEKEGFVLLQSQYYGGIKKFLYLNTPLALHGPVVTKDGGTVEVHVGDDPDDPVLVIPDLLIHLSYYGNAGADIDGEDLDPLAGSAAAGDTSADIRTRVMALLAEKYGITEEDFVSADLELVPAGPARDVGFDRSMVGGYGQDDRACVYAAARAVTDLRRPVRTAMVLVDDREEVGYPGATGYRSPFLADVVADLLAATGAAADERAVRACMSKSMLYYCDATPAVNPLFPEVHELGNAPRLGHGPVINTLADRLADIARLRRLFDDKGIAWQTGQFGKSPGMSGGNRSTFEQGMNVLYLGMPALSLHSPFSVTSKADVYESYRAYKVLLEN